MINKIFDFKYSRVERQFLWNTTQYDLLTILALEQEVFVDENTIYFWLSTGILSLLLYSGSASAEYFLEHSYAVIFMHRQKSLEPFTRHFNGQQFFDMLELSDREVGPSSTISGNISSI